MAVIKEAKRHESNEQNEKEIQHLHRLGQKTSETKVKGTKPRKEDIQSIMVMITEDKDKRNGTETGSSRFMNENTGKAKVTAGGG